MASKMLRTVSTGNTYCQQMRTLNISKNRMISCSSVRSASSKENVEDQVKTESNIDTKGEIVDPKKEGAWRTPVQYMKDSHRDIVSQASIGDYSFPNNIDKVSLLWSGYYERREDIPPFLSVKRVTLANDKLRVIIMYWILWMSFCFLMTMLHMGKRRVKKYHKMITEKQNRVWAARKSQHA